GVDVHVLDGMSETALDRLEAGECDLALVVVGRFRPKTRSAPLVRDRFQAVLPMGHPLAERAALTWAELATEPFVVTGGDSSVRRDAENALSDAGVLSPHLIQAGNISTVGGLGAAGTGVSALPALALPRMGFASHVRRPIEGPVTERGVSVVVPEHGHPSPVARRFLRVLRVMRKEEVALPEGAEWERRGIRGVEQAHGYRVLRGHPGPSCAERPRAPCSGAHRIGRPVICRPMMSLWISLAPSKIVKIVASRCQRSTGYSRV